MSTTGFYRWRSRPDSATAQRRRHLATLFTAILEDSHHTYGHRRVHAVLVRSGVPAGLDLVRDIMRELDLHARQP